MQLNFIGNSETDAHRLRTLFGRVDKTFLTQGCFSLSQLKRGVDLTYNTEAIFFGWGCRGLTPEELSAAFPCLKAAFYLGGDTGPYEPAFTAIGVPLFSCLTENSRSTAEFAFAQIILANKGYYRATRSYIPWMWPLNFRYAKAKANLAYGNFGATVGIVGFGNVGRLVITQLRRFDLALLVHDPFVEDIEIERAGATAATLQCLVESSDVVSLHLPIRETASPLLDHANIAKLKKQSTLINTSRGHHISEDAIANIASQRPDLTFVLDVTRREPLPFWSPLWRRKNVFLSPHIAGVSDQELPRLVIYLSEIYERWSAELTAKL